MQPWNDLTVVIDELDSLRAQLREARAQERTARFHELLKAPSFRGVVAVVTELSGGETLVHWHGIHKPLSIYPSALDMRRDLIDTGEYLLSVVSVSERRETYGREVKTAHQALNPREVAALRGLSHGMSDGEIAAEQGLALKTVRNNNQRLFRKLGVRSRTQAALIARDLDLLGIP